MLKARYTLAAAAYLMAGHRYHAPVRFAPARFASVSSALVKSASVRSALVRFAFLLEADGSLLTGLARR
jgi:hypothetical protein